MIKTNALANQFVKFGIVGVSNTLIYLLVYYIFIWINVELYLVGNVIGFVVSVFNSYYWNNRFVFKAEKCYDVKSMVKAYISYGITSALSVVFIFILVEKLFVSEMIAPIINLIITIPINFLLNKYWIFR